MGTSHEQFAIKNLMFSSEHIIWKWANWWDELDDWLPYAENLVKEWASQNSDNVMFADEFQIRIASFLLVDDLLPLSAKKAYAYLVLDTMAETKKKKLSLETLHIHPPPPGRKKDGQATYHRNHAVNALLKEGHPKQDAYNLVAKQFHKSPDTIRRDYERLLRRHKKRKEGEIEK